MAFDAPNINVTKKSNEENIQTIKSYLTNMAEELNYKLDQLQSEIDALSSGEES